MAHEDPIPPRTREEAEALRERIDPETRARRDAALKLVRQYGDPVLRSRALEVERFDERLADEIRRMGQVMHDALGIGLAATQVGVMHRVLVYRVDPDAPAGQGSLPCQSLPRSSRFELVELPLLPALWR